MQNNPRAIVIHCSDVSERTIYDQLKSINAYHRDVRGFPRSSLGYYVGYHYLITGGKEYVCRADYDEGAHCNQILDRVSMNFQSIGICVGFDGDLEYPSPAHYELLKRRIADVRSRYGISRGRVFLHRDFAKDKTCPGSLITPDWLNKLMDDAEAKPPSKKEKQKLIEELNAKVSLLRQLVEALQLFNLLKNRKTVGMSEKLPAWYESTQGPQVSSTLMNLAGTFIPVVDLLLVHFGVTIPGLTETVNALIASAVFIFFAAKTAIGYVRAKVTLGARIDTLRAQVSDLGGTPK